MDNFIVDFLRLRTSDAEVAVRYLTFMGVSLVFGLILWLSHRKFAASRRRRVGRWRRLTKRLGLDAFERDLVAELARRAGRVSPASLLRSRAAFEEAVERGADLVAENPTHDGALERIRRKAGWDRIPLRRPYSNLALLRTSLPVQILGPGGKGCAISGLVVHRYPGSLIVRLEAVEEPPPWRMGDSVQVCFRMKGDAEYAFQSEIREFRGGGNELCLVLSLPSQVQRQQRRLHVRVPYEYTILFRHIPQGSPRTSVEAQGTTPHEGRVEDLSVGGFRLRSDLVFEREDLIAIQDFPPAGPGEVFARVMFRKSHRAGEEGRYGLEFVGLSNSRQDRVARLVAQIQRESITREIVPTR